MRSTMVLIPKEGDIKKASRIYKVILLYIFLKSLSKYKRGTLL